MRGYTVALVSVSAALSVVLILFSGSRFEKLLRPVSFALVAVFALAPIAGLFKNDTLSQIENRIAEIESRSNSEALSACVSEIERRCHAVIGERFPDAGFTNVEIEAEGNSPEEIRVISCTAFSDGDIPDEAVEYIREILGCADVKIISEVG